LVESDGCYRAGESLKATRRRTSPRERRLARGEIDDPNVVMEAAAAFLAVRPRSISETRRRLRHLGYRHELVDGVVERLVEMHYLDDDAFSRAWVESRDRARPRGVIALRRELAQKGVERGVIDAVLGERDEPGVPGPTAATDEAQASADAVAAQRLLERRLPALMREGDPRRRRQKAYALLARNGFDPEICREVSARLLVADSE
jgi:regulatory protein